MDCKQERERIKGVEKKQRNKGETRWQKKKKKNTFSVRAELDRTNSLFVKIELIPSLYFIGSKLVECDISCNGSAGKDVSRRVEVDIKRVGVGGNVRDSEGLLQNGHRLS